MIRSWKCAVRSPTRDSTSTCATSASSPRRWRRSLRWPPRARSRDCPASPICAATRPTGWPRCPPRSTGSAATAVKPPTGWRSLQQPLRPGTWRSYADHRMATAGAIIGLRVDGRRGRRHRDHRQDAAEFRCDVGRHAAELVAVEAGRLRRVRRQDAHRIRALARGPRPARNMPTPSRRWWSASTAAAGDVCSTATSDRHVTAMRARELGRTPIVVGDDVDIVGDLSGRPTPWPASCGADRGEQCCGAPPMTPTRPSGWSSPTPISC